MRVSWWHARHDGRDAWERFVLVHAALIGATPVWFPDGRTGPDSVPWPCLKCGEQLVIARPVTSDDGTYYYWCRCGVHDSAHASEYNERYRGKVHARTKS